MQSGQLDKVSENGKEHNSCISNTLWNKPKLTKLNNFYKKKDKIAYFVLIVIYTFKKRPTHSHSFNFRFALANVPSISVNAVLQ